MRITITHPALVIPMIPHHDYGVPVNYYVNFILKAPAW